MLAPPSPVKSCYGWVCGRGGRCFPCWEISFGALHLSCLRPWRYLVLRGMCWFEELPLVLGWLKPLPLSSGICLMQLRKLPGAETVHVWQNTGQDECSAGDSLRSYGLDTGITKSIFPAYLLQKVKLRNYKAFHLSVPLSHTHTKSALPFIFLVLLSLQSAASKFLQNSWRKDGE